jgi:hypothetical protein
LTSRTGSGCSCTAARGVSAGRNYRRSAARKTFNREQLDASMAGIEWGRSDAFLDEIPDAYKPIDQIMADAAVRGCELPGGGITSCRPPGIPGAGLVLAREFEGVMT